MSIITNFDALELISAFLPAATLAACSQADSKIRAFMRDLPNPCITVSLKCQMEAKDQISYRDYLVWKRACESLGNPQPVPNAVHLDLSGSDVDDAELAAVIANCPNLRSINLTKCTKLTDVGIASLRNHPTLQSINLSWCCRISEDSFNHLSTLPQLQEIDASHCILLSDDGVAFLRDHPSLRRVNLERCTLVTDEGIQHLSTLPNLQEANLSWCEVSDAGLLYLRNHPAIRTLNLSWCDQVTEIGIDSLRDVQIIS